MKLSIRRKVIFVLLVSQFLTGFTGHNQMIELEEHVYARSTAQFSRYRHNNKIAILTPGTRGEILEKVRFPSGNYGLRIRLLNGSRVGQEAWVHYNVSQPLLSLHSSTTPDAPEAKPEAANAAVTRANVPAISEEAPVQEAPRRGLATGVCLSDNRSILTHYNSNPKSYRSRAEAKMEGGATTRHGELLNSVEEAIQNGRPVSLAADTNGSFGKRCNRLNSRCTLLVHSRGFDKRYPEYKKRFPGLPEDTFVGIIEDTGGAFRNKGTAKIDFAVRNRGIANGITDKNMHFTEIENPCGKSKRARYCNLSGLKVVDQCHVARNRTAANANVASSTGLGETAETAR